MSIETLDTDNTAAALPEKPGMKSLLRERLFELEQTRRSALYPIWNELGLIAGQPRVLSRLIRKDKVTQKELSDACGIDPATLSRALDRLETMGYLIRSPHPSCRRSLLVSLTESGRQKALQVMDAFHLMEEKMFDGFTQEEQTLLLAFLEQIKNNLSQ